MTISAALLPNGRKQFIDANGSPVAGGSVYYYQPGTTTLKTTWLDNGQVTPNTNPVILDAAGSAVVYGAGTYREYVTDALGNLISDSVTDSVVSAAMLPVVGASTTTIALENLGVSAAMVPVVGATTTTAALENLGVSAAMVPVVGATTTTAALRQLLTPTANAAAVPNTLTSAPSYTGSEGSITTAFEGDFSNSALTISTAISGAATLGQPSSGYTYTDPAYPIFGYLANSSGYNSSTSGNGGRTAAVFQRVIVQQNGQGDAVAFNAEVYVNSTLPGATSWLANPAGVIINGDVFAGASGVYLNPQEIDLSDNGYDVAAIGLVHNLNRTNNTGALGAPWGGYRAQSIGNKSADFVISASGDFSWGLDFTTGTFTNQQAIGLGANQRIYFDAANTGGFSNGTSNGSVYISYNSTAGNLTFNNGTELLAISNSAVSTNVPIAVGGAVTPVTDNTYSLGGASNRWSAVYAANGVIQTSDSALKTDISPLPASLALIAAIDPVTYRWKTGGVDVEHDARGHVTKTNARPGKRTHWGFLADDIAKIAGISGRDFGGFVQDADGTKHMRPDQLIPILWKAVQELAAEVAALKLSIPPAATRTIP